MIHYGDHVDDHENIRGRGQNPWSTQPKKKSERTALQILPVHNYLRQKLA
jgi:hypothetical protein